VFLVIDGFDIVRGNFEALESIVTDIASRGLAFGVHVVLSAGRWAVIRPALKDRLETRVELRLGDPADSEPGRNMASSVPLGRPGRGLTPDGEHMLMALPSLDNVAHPAEVVEGLVAAVHQLNSRSPGPGAPEIRLLPVRLAHDELLRAAAERDAVVLPRERLLRFPLGLNESELAPVHIDFGTTPHFVIFGDAESGKTNLLRLLVSGICESNDPASVQIVAADPRRTLLGDIPSGCEAAYATSSSSLTTVIAELVAFLEKRAPPPDVTPQQLHERSWWSGPELYVLVDDYELLVSGGGSPLSRLLEHLPHARDLGFHLILARRASGAARALYDPVIARMKDLGSAGLVMSGNRAEGVLLGTTKPTPLPPGRGVLVTRAGEEMIQTALLPPAAVAG
jgi:DNA segregation ATPase FtsK/SpoIIIE, S-DNA-T family